MKPDTYLLQKFSFLYSADRFHGIAVLHDANGFTAGFPPSVNATYSGAISRRAISRRAISRRAISHRNTA